MSATMGKTLRIQAPEAPLTARLATLPRRRPA